LPECITASRQGPRMTAGRGDVPRRDRGCRLRPTGGALLSACGDDPWRITAAALAVPSRGAYLERETAPVSDKDT
jgi:hypothetical protein